MKIVELYAENIKRLTAVQIAPSGALVEITGKNGNGKTSVLDSIWWALEGAKHIQAAPIRKGATEALIRLDLGDLKVTRTFRKAKGDADVITTSLVVESAEGARYPKAQQVLDELVGALSMDPLEFMRAKPADQLATLRAFVPEFDFAANDKANKEDFDKRTEVNRNAKALRSQAAGITVAADAPTERIDDAALVEELERAGQHNADIEARKASRQSALDQIAAHHAMAEDAAKRIEQLREQISLLQRSIEDRRKAANDIAARLENAGPLPDPIDTADIRRRIANANAANAQFAQRQRRKEIEDRAAHHEHHSEVLTAAIEARKDLAAKAVAAAKMPVPGLELGDDGVLLDGLPLDQASDAQQLRTSIAIAMAINPKLRVIRVRDGSLLDDDAMQILAEMAEGYDYQVWIERVDSSGKVGFVIEDGAVKARPVPVAAE